MSIRAVTFDFHDTLAECDVWFQLEIRGLVPAFLDWHSSHVSGVPVSDATKQQSIAEYRAIRQRVIDDGIEQDAATCLKLVLQRLDFRVEPDLLETGLEAIMRAALPDANPKPGAIEAVQNIASAGVPMAVISSAVYHPFLEWTLEAFGIRDCFELIVTSACSGHYKSSPEIYIYTVRKLGIEPNECVHIGDSARFDVTTARRAGLRTVWVHWGNEATDGHSADLAVPTLHGVAPRVLTEL